MKTAKLFDTRASSESLRFTPRRSIYSIRNNFSLDLYQFVAKESNSLKTWRILIPIKLILFRIRQQKCHRVRKSGCFRCFGFNLHNSQLSWLSSMFFLWNYSKWRNSIQSSSPLKVFWTKSSVLLIHFQHFSELKQIILAIWWNNLFKMQNVPSILTKTVKIVIRTLYT